MVVHGRVDLLTSTSQAETVAGGGVLIYADVDVVTIITSGYRSGTEWSWTV